MPSTELNAELCRVGPGTPMGELMRRYWQPIAASAQITQREPTKAVRILGEDLVLFRDRQGGVGLVGPKCAHRGVSMLYSVPEDNGLRCCYHGWLYDKTGQCVERPNEPKSSADNLRRVKIPGYPVQELGGLIFAYLGPEPAPLLPRWDVLAWSNVSRKVSIAILPCNWLQCMENSLDPVHFEWLHRYYGTFEMLRQNPDRKLDEWDSQTAMRGKHHIRLGFERTDYGVIKRRLLEGETEADDHWRLGHPVLFPHCLRVGLYDWHGLHYRVPIDDEHTLHIMCDLDLPQPGETREQQEVVPAKVWPLFDENGKLIYTFPGPHEPYHVVAQDQIAWIAQGPISDRSEERLAATDIGIVWYRKLLKEQMDIVASGGEPMNVHRDPERNECIVLPAEFSRYPGDKAGETGGPFKNYTPRQPDVERSLA
ncbi:Rieske 2Fe-2S domain-containing protein [Roseiarcaceae bacterium H3SJ34-1]|uniref:Rieske 2Fe-2S domain-containing protein n=1 Tax=Terripilifer ovatus TaxID=3032367 RepID=UPI003AB99A6F|nr:Rieske 2Fe-2S domain-containing protein [Roseiarcaceae bacterium H3SJ34-1]